VKEAELRLMCELLKNCRRSDRQLAKAIGTSQPTVQRIRRRLEQSGLIKEYTVVPDFAKLGYELLTFIFLKYEREIPEDRYELLKAKAMDLEGKSSSSTIMVLNGLGADMNRVVVSFHRDYSTFSRYVSHMKNLEGFGIKYAGSFVVSLETLKNARPLTLSVLAEHLPLLQRQGQVLNSTSLST
jgi:DNA-binding Lrp family transcriptional regulator